MQSTVYLITCPGGLRYVGGTIQKLQDRLSEHRSERSTCRLIRDAIHRHGWENMQISVLVRCPPDSVEQNESFYIEFLDTVHPRGYNLRCGNNAGAPSPCGMELSSVVLDPTEATDEVRKAVADDLEGITGIRPPAMTWSGPGPLTDYVLLKDDGFPPSNNGIRLTIDLSMVDIMDCFMFVSASYGAARVMKSKYMSNEPMVAVVWQNVYPKRKRDTCSTAAMLSALGLCSKMEAAVLSKRITDMTATTVSREDVAEYAHNATSAKDDIVDEHAHKKRTIHAEEEDSARGRKLANVQKKIKFLKKIGEHSRAESLLEKYMDI